MLVLVTYGLGMLIGAQVAGKVYNGFLGSSAALSNMQWQNFWWIPAVFAAVIMIFFALTFKDEVEKE